MTAEIKLYGVTLDCPDPKALGNFYRELAGLEETYSDDNFVGLATSGGAAINFQRVSDYRPPQWPGQQVPQQFHLDFSVDDLALAEKRAIELGATKPDDQPGERWSVLLDPAGHPFCLAASS
jgi:catechol 2,3-dioxygenase-like lactoylglutathione lyase family enzyme